MAVVVEAVGFYFGVVGFVELGEVFEFGGVLEDFYVVY